MNCMTTSQFTLFHRILVLNQEKAKGENDRPPIEKDYNHYMGGVDLWDMMIKFIEQTSEATNGTCELFTIELIWQL